MPWEETEKEIRHRLKDPQLYETCRSKDLGGGVRMIYCKRKDNGEWEAQALRFDKEKFTVKQAKKWLEEHKDSFAEKELFDESDEEITMESEQFEEIKGLEIFKIGTAETKNYTIKDLDNMVKKAEEGIHEAPVVISHDENQDLLAADKLPAAGWIKKLYRKGKSLFADIVDVPKVVAELIRKKALKKRSVEIYHDFVDDAGKHHGKVIRRLALLGGAIPRIKSLSDHLALYEETKQEFSTVSFSEMDESIEGTMKQDEFSRKLDDIYWIFRDKLWKVWWDQEATDDEKKTRFKSLIDEFASLIQEIFKDTIGSFSENNREDNQMSTENKMKIEEEAKKRYVEEFAEKYGISPEEAVQKMKEMERKQKEEEINRFCENLKREGLAPVIVDQYKEILTKATFDSFTEGESLNERLNQLMADIAKHVKEGTAYVEFQEKGKVGANGADVDKDTKKFGENAVNIDLMKKAKAYAKEHKISFAEAMQVVANEEEE